MTLKPTDAGEPTIVALVDAMKAWQRTLDTTLSASGLTYVKWILLRGIARADYVRHEPYVSAVFIDVEMAERLLAELHRDRWIGFADPAGRACGPTAPDGQPHIAEHQRRRIERIALAMKALHSVSVSPFSSDERALLCRLLQKMQQTLNDHSDRQHARHEEIDEIEVARTPMIHAHAMLGATACMPSRSGAGPRIRPAVPARSGLSWRG